MIVETSVTHVVINGDTKGQKLRLLMGYAKNIIKSRPLRQAVLELNILLMGDIAGIKIGTKFVRSPGSDHAGALIISIKKQKLFAGFDINNQGTPVLDCTQMVFNGGINCLFRGGELLSHSADHSASGQAQIFSLGINVPVIRRLHTNLLLSAGLNILNADNALLSTTISNERTRVLQFGVFYSDDKYLSRITRAQMVVSEGGQYIRGTPRQHRLWRNGFHEK